jgi:hypothetical protein
MESAAELRAQAAKCRALAKQARDRMTVKNLLALAEDYEAQAQTLESSLVPRPTLPTPD